MLKCKTCNIENVELFEHRNKKDGLHYYCKTCYATLVKYFAIAALRKASYRWYPRSRIEQLARVGRNQYKCSKCLNVFKKNEVKKDHIIPVVPVTGWESFDSYVPRILIPVQGFQILCVSCHKEKTRLEGIQRKALRKK